MEISWPARTPTLYTKELLNRHDAWRRGKPLSIPRHPLEPEEELDRTAEEICDAQKLAGELLWLSTKTRPDLAYAVSKICTAKGANVVNCTKHGGVGLPQRGTKTGSEIPDFSEM